MTNSVVRSSFVLVGLVVWASALEAAEPTSAMQEVKDRMVDGAANATQKIAIRKLREQIVKDKGSPREPLLLVRLADLQEREAETLFRVVLAPVSVDPSKEAKKELTVQAHREAVTELVATLNTFL